MSIITSSSSGQGRPSPSKNGIAWYYEQEGSGPHVVLIPDRLGECHMMDNPITPDELHIDYATFWGCSPVLGLAAEYPDLLKMAETEDEAIVKMLGEERPKMNFGHDLTAWQELDKEAHARMRKKYPRWAPWLPAYSPALFP
ncbi:hypothetical protein DL771_009305 [Monosporascus sp. 5C6A]|nr:hypothetical protein DL771_009305 [Monosporascus sp. 5C6A]